MQQLPFPPHANGVTLCLEELLPYQKYAVRWRPPALSLWAQLAGNHRSHVLGRGMAFSEVRHYQAGDDIRAMDWRVMARTGKPHTKLFTQEREKPVIVYIDLSHSMQFGSQLLLKSVQAAHFASLVAWLTIANQDSIGAVIDLGHQLIEVKPQRRQSGVFTLLAKLIEAQQQALTSQPSLPLVQGLTYLQRLCPKGSDIIFISDFTRYHAELNAYFLQLSTHNTLRWVHIYDPLEQGVTDFRGIQAVQAHQQTHWVNFASKNTRNSIKNIFSETVAKQKNFTQMAGIDYHLLSSQTPLLQQLSVLDH